MHEYDCKVSWNPNKKDAFGVKHYDTENEQSRAVLRVR